MSHKNLLDRLHSSTDSVILKKKKNPRNQKTQRKLEREQSHNIDLKQKHDLYSKETLPNPIHKPPCQRSLLLQTHILLPTKGKPQHPTTSTLWNQVKQHKIQKYILKMSTQRLKIQETGVRQEKDESKYTKKKNSKRTEKQLNIMETIQKIKPLQS